MFEILKHFAIFVSLLDNRWYFQDI